MTSSWSPVNSLWFGDAIWRQNLYQHRLRLLNGTKPLNAEHRFVGTDTQRAHDALITSLWRKNDVTTSFQRHNYVIRAPCVRWVFACHVVYINKHQSINRISILILRFADVRNTAMYICIYVNHWISTKTTIENPFLASFLYFDQSNHQNSRWPPAANLKQIGKKKRVISLFLPNVA